MCYFRSTTEKARLSSFHLKKGAIIAFNSGKNIEKMVASYIPHPTVAIDERYRFLSVILTRTFLAQLNVILP
jgi:hypothetical protein